MKKYLYILMIATLILVSSTAVRASSEVYYTNRENIEMTEQEYNNLLGLGFTEKQIERMDYDEFMFNKDLEADVVSEVTQHVRTTVTIKNGIKTTTSTILDDEQYEEALEMQSMQSLIPSYSPNVSGYFYDGLAYDSVKTLTSYIAIFNDTDYARYKMDMQWDVMPSTRSHDIIGIAIQNDRVHVVSIIKFRQDWETTGGSFGHSSYGYDMVDTYGGSYVYELPTGSMSVMESYIYFNVAKNTGVGTITYLVASGDYAHAYNTVSYQVKDHYGFRNTTGLDIEDPYYVNYDEIPMAHATFQGTW